MRPLLLSCISLLLAAPSAAVVHDLMDGSANTTPPADDPGFAHIGNRGGLSVVYIGNGWVLTADHVPFGSSTFGGVPYPGAAGSKVTLQPEGGATLPPDLALWRLEEPWPALPWLLIQENPPSLADPVTMIGNGADRIAEALCGVTPAYSWGGGHTIRWGTNHVEGFETVELPSGTPTRETASLVSFFDCQCDSDGGTEAMAVDGDSGGGVFLKSGGVWRLAGIMFGVGRCQSGLASQGSSLLQLGDRTFSADLSVYRSQILAIAAPPIPALPLWGVPLLAGLLGASGVGLLRRAPRR